MSDSTRTTTARPAREPTDGSRNGHDTVPAEPPVAGAAAAAVRGRAGHGWPWWVGVAVAALAVWSVLTWPFLLHLNDFQHWRGGLPGEEVTADEAMHVGDHLQNVFIYSVVVDNARELREPYLDLGEGAAGPSPLKTTSLNVPWSIVVGLLWPATGLAAAYNLTLLLSSVATALAAYGLLRRHTRYGLLAVAGALLYAAAPHRMWQLVGHFNAVMWWAFPAVLWAAEAMLERWQTSRAGMAATTGRRRGGWGWPAAGVVLVGLTVAVSGELHLAMYISALLGFAALYAVVAALVRRTPLPWVPVGVLLGTIAGVVGYSLFAFGYVFRGSVDGPNGSWAELLNYAVGPKALLRKNAALGGESIVYVGELVAALALIGFVIVLVRWRREVRALPYALLLPAVLFFTFGPRLAYGPIQPYRVFFEHVPFLAFLRVPQRLMVITMLVIVLLAVVGADRLGGLVIDRLAGRADGGRRRLAPLVSGVAAVLAVVATLTVLQDYQVGSSRMVSGETDNDVIERLAADGDANGPILGLPLAGKTSPLNSASTYVGAISRRQVLNAYNQTPAQWLDARVEALDPLNRGIVTDSALAVLQQTGTRQIVVLNEPGLFKTGQAWRETIDALVASGHFRVETIDAPMALLTRTP